MDFYDYQQVKNAMLLAFNNVAPTGKEQRALVSMLHEAEHAKESNEAIILMLADAIANGLRYGNWPQPKE